MMSNHRATSTSPTSTSAPPSPGAGVTSRVITRVAAALAAGQHPLLTGAVDDLVMVQGRLMPLSEALTRIVSQLHEVVVLVNAADGMSIVSGEELFEELRSQLDLPDGVIRPGVQVGQDDGAGDATATQEDEHTNSRSSRIGRARRNDTDHDDPCSMMAVVRQLMAQSTISVAVIIEQADLLLMDPELHDREDRRAVAQAQLALSEAQIVGQCRNSVLMLSRSVESIPAVLANPGSGLQTIEVEIPGRAERVEAIRQHIEAAWRSAELDPANTTAVVDLLADLTNGERLSTVVAIPAFSGRARIGLDDPRELVRTFRNGPAPDHWSHLRDRLPEVRDQMSTRLFGQEQAIDRTIEMLSEAALGMTMNRRRSHNAGQHRAVLVLVGPTGVGKTELAKTIAEILFGDAEACVRFDMATMTQPHDVSRLLGSPPGYVGFEQGGELTSAVQERPNLVVLLDEVTKAHPNVFKQLMSIVDDGHIRDARGQITYFTDTVIIMTSNAGADELIDLVERDGDAISYEDVARHSVEAVRRRFAEINLSEFFGRIEPGIVPFDVLRLPVVDRITARLIDDFGFRDGPTVVFDRDSTIAYIRRRLEQPGARVLGGRQVRNEFRRMTGRLASTLALKHMAGAERVQISFRGDEMVLAVD